MTKFLAFDMANADGVELNLVLFTLMGYVPEKLDELHLTVKYEKQFNGTTWDMLDLFCSLDNESAEKFWDFIGKTNILIVKNEALDCAVALYCGSGKFIVNISEMAKCLNFDMELGANKCDVIMNTVASIWKKQTFVCAV